jgi:hypothetical protein
MWRRAVLVVFCLAGCALANREFIESQVGCVIGEVPAGESGSRTYHFPEISIGVLNCTGPIESRCNQSIDNNLLQGRSWFISQDKAYFGRGYNPNSFQVYNLECPAGHYLNLGFQGAYAMFCPRDSVTVNTTRYGFTGALCTDIEKEVSYPNRPGGVILEDANVKIDFCSDGTGMASGFTIRGTCINPHVAYNQPSCVSYDFFRVWDPEFVNSVFEEFDIVPTTMVPHKRSAAEHLKSFESIRDKVDELRALAREESERIENMKVEKDVREKRGVRYIFEFPAGTTITYIENVLTFSFPNGTVRTFPAYYLAASNDLYGTRVYIRNATRQVGDTTGATTITFTGPGRVDIFPNRDRTSINAYLIWTPPMPFDEFLETEGSQQQIIAGRIYDYIVDFWISPYVVIDNFLIERQPGLKPYPFGSGKDFFFPQNVRRRTQLEYVSPVISRGSVCRAITRFDVAPLRNSGIDEDLLTFCSFFQVYAASLQTRIS